MPLHDWWTAEGSVQLPCRRIFCSFWNTGFADRTLDTAISHSVMTNFVPPYKGCALVVVFMDMDQVQAHMGQKSRRVLSVRT